MSERCKFCGFILTTEKFICPLCEHSINDEIDEKAINELDKLFEEKSINIEFNSFNLLNNIDNDMDSEYIIPQVKECNKKDQYSQIDITENNINNLNNIIDYYLEDIDIYKKNEKNKLESMGIEQLQNKIQKFNKVVNDCTKFKKIVKLKSLLEKITNTINTYNKEIHYIKQYFVYPLYNAEDLLNGSKIAKTIINLFSLFIGYYIITKIGILKPIYDFILYFFNQTDSISLNLKNGNIDNLFSVLFAIWLTNIIFPIYISLTIKSKNFEIEKDKSYEAIITFTIVGYLVQNYNVYLAYIYNISFIIYIFYLLITGIFIKKKRLEWQIIKLIGLCLSLPLFYNLITYFF